MKRRGQHSGRELKERLRDGAATFGTFVGGGSSVMAEVCATAGVDWLLLDLEHGTGGEEQLGGVVPAGAMHGVPTVVRTESFDRVRAGRVLDQGAAGVMFPRIESVGEAQQAVSSLRYAPSGVRGVATYNRACSYGLHPEALTTADDDTLGIVQVETLGALDDVEQIAAVDGVDVVFVGPRDLTHALGVPGDIQHPTYLDALGRVLAATRAAGTAAGVLVSTGEQAAVLAAQGWQFVAIGSDTTLLANALSHHLTMASASSR